MFDVTRVSILCGKSLVLSLCHLLVSDLLLAVLESFVKLIPRLNANRGLSGSVAEIPTIYHGVHAIFLELLSRLWITLF